jgi:hypothetical protein
MACPVTKEASSEHIHTTHWLFPGCPMRPTGSNAVNCIFFLFSRKAIHHGVCITPGQTAFTRIPCSAYSNAGFVNPITPCLRRRMQAVLKPTSPATEEQLTMVPLPCLSISEFHVACRAKSLSGLYGFIPIFLCAISRGAESLQYRHC